MIYESCSVKEVIGKVFRDTGCRQASFAVSMQEWIPSAMGLIKTKFRLRRTFKWVDIEFYKGRLPCGMRGLIAVLYKGQRMVPYNGKGAAGLSRPNSNYSGTNAFVSMPFNIDGDGFNITNLSQISMLSECTEAWYYTEMDWLTTSIEEGTVCLVYYEIPMDSEGFPLVPDNEDYKEALYYFVRAKMITAGWVDKALTEAECMNRFWMHSKKARVSLADKTVDQAERMVPNIWRFVMHDNWWEDNTIPMIPSAAKGGTVEGYINPPSEIGPW